MAEFTVYRSGKPIQFTSPLLDEEAIAQLRELVSAGKITSNFAKDMAKLTLATASIRQMPWIHKLVLDYAAENAQPAVQTAKTYNFIQLVALLEYARREGKIKRPVLRIQRGDVHIKLRFAGDQSANPGCIYIIEQSTDTYLGKINRNGSYDPRNLSEAILEALAEVAKNPLEAATLYGRRTGHCCFCGRHLDHTNSVELGYGPICAEKWGMFHSYERGSVEINTPKPSEIMEAAGEDQV